MYSRFGIKFVIYACLYDMRQIICVSRAKWYSGVPKWLLPVKPEEYANSAATASKIGITTSKMHLVGWSECLLWATPSFDVEKAVNELCGEGASAIRHTSQPPV
jgi:hypothetical protein